MQITGKSLELVSRACELALQELQNEVGSCPNVYEHADHLEEIEQEEDEIKKFKARVDRAIKREKGSADKA